MAFLAVVIMVIVNYERIHNNTYLGTLLSKFDMIAYESRVSIHVYLKFYYYSRYRIFFW